jgi:hypothetical protein
MDIKLGLEKASQHYWYKDIFLENFLWISKSQGFRERALNLKDQPIWACR